MNERTKTLAGVEAATDEVLLELTQRVEAIDNSYRAVAQKMGQLYMFADEHKFTALTQSFDKPMRNASENEQSFSGMLDELRAIAHQRNLTPD